MEEDLEGTRYELMALLEALPVGVCYLTNTTYKVYVEACSGGVRRLRHQCW